MTESFTQGMRRIAYPVCIAASAHKGKKLAVTVSSVTSVSIDPPTLLVCINMLSSMITVIKTNSLININFLSASQSDIAEICSQKNNADVRFKHDQWRYDKNMIPFLAGSEMIAFCKVSNVVKHATHAIAMLSIIDVCYDQRVKADPLLYKNGRYLGSVT